VSAAVQVSTHFVRPLSRALDARGIEPEPWLEELGLGGDHPRRVPIEDAGDEVRMRYLTTGHCGAARGAAPWIVEASP